MSAIERVSEGPIVFLSANAILITNEHNSASEEKFWRALVYDMVDSKQELTLNTNRKQWYTFPMKIFSLSKAP